MSKASARRMRRKARATYVSTIAHNAQNLTRAVQPLPSTLVPVAEWHVQVRELPNEGSIRFCFQRFAAMPAEDGKVWLCTNPKRGARRIGQAAFDTWQQAMSYSEQVYRLNGCAIRV